jgi:hypothetical protein
MLNSVWIPSYSVLIVLVPSVFHDLPLGDCTPGCHHLVYTHFSQMNMGQGVPLLSAAHLASLERQPLLSTLSYGETQRIGEYDSLV